MDVFTSLLTMCAFARKFIAKGRFKKWVINAFLGQDAELAGARGAMDQNLARLESATAYAILANTEDMKYNQKELLDMQAKLQKNQTEQYELAQSQSHMLETLQRSNENVREGVSDIQAGMKEVLALIKKQEMSDDAKPVKTESSGPTSNKIRSIIADNLDNNSRLRQLRETRVSGTGEWFFRNPDWKAWLDSTESSLFVLSGPSGVGKSCLASIVYDHLLQKFRRDPGGFSIITYFFCDKNTDTLNSFQSLVNAVVLQISKKNSSLSGRFSRRFGAEKASMTEKEYLEELIFPCFGRESKYNLIIIVDDFDELKSDVDEKSVMSMADKIKDLGLRIKILATKRIDSLSEKTNGSTFKLKLQDGMTSHHITKNDIVPDIESVIGDRFQSPDSVYACLRTLREPSKDLIRSTIKNQTSNMLYVDLALKYLSGIGREGAILRVMNEDLPPNLDSLFERMLRGCKRRLPQDLVLTVQSLMAWLTYGFEVIDLDQANHLARAQSVDKHVRIEEEIGDILARFLQVGPSVTQTSGADTVDLPSQEPYSDSYRPEHAYEDGLLPVTFRDRSIRDFFSTLDPDMWTKLDATSVSNGIERNPSKSLSAGHRLIFLDCCKLLIDQRSAFAQDQRTAGSRKLRQYAVKHCLRHWQYINPNQHDPSENVEVCNAFYELLSNRYGFAAMLEDNSASLLIDQVLRNDLLGPREQGADNFKEKWKQWSALVKEMMLKDDDRQLSSKLAVGDYWNGDKDAALLPLVRAHMDNWLDPTTWLGALRAYASVRRSMRHVSQV